MQPSQLSPKRTGFTPSQIVVFGFLAVNIIGTMLLMLPISSAAPGSTDLLAAAFTSVSSLSVTGLGVVNTATHWTFFGQAVILLLIKVGGFGIMALGSLLALMLTQRVSFKTKITSTEETKSLGLSDFKGLLIRVFVISAAIELTITAILTVHLHFGYGEPLETALWNAFFQSVAAFNNAGMSTYPDSLMSFVRDPLVLLSLSFAVIIGGLGFPVLIELTRRLRQRIVSATGGGKKLDYHWSLTARLTITFTVALLVLGTIFIGAIEWSNPGTLGGLSTSDRIINAFVASVMARTAGFNAVDYALMHNESWIGTDILMFIGGGSAGTSGGLRITTFAVLIYLVLAEIRGDREVNVGSRRIGFSVQRTAVSLAVLASTVVLVGVVSIELITDLPTDKIVFEVISAFGTVGLSTGITAELPALGKIILMILMFVGRIGLVLVATALAQRASNLSYRLPKERPLIG